MENTQFRRIDNIKDYLSEALSEGRLQPGTYRKFATVTARVGTVGEKVSTVMADGLHETDNVVSADENGNPGWVVTNPSGEQYIVQDSTFTAKYEKIDGTPDQFRPKGAPIVAGQVNESIRFDAPWGEEIRLVAGGYLVFTDRDDIYAIQEKEFLETYKKTEE